jgi:hypothetical protein
MSACTEKCQHIGPDGGWDHEARLEEDRGEIHTDDCGFFHCRHDHDPGECCTAGQPGVVCRVPRRSPPGGTPNRPTKCLHGDRWHYSDTPCGGAASRSEQSEPPPCHLEGDVEGVRRICNRPLGHPPPHLMDLTRFDAAFEPQNVPAPTLVAFAGEEKWGTTADGRVPVKCIVMTAHSAAIPENRRSGAASRSEQSAHADVEVTWTGRLACTDDDIKTARMVAAGRLDPLAAAPAAEAAQSPQVGAADDGCGDPACPHCPADSPVASADPELAALLREARDLLGIVSPAQTVPLKARIDSALSRLAGPGK